MIYLDIQYMDILARRESFPLHPRSAGGHAAMICLDLGVISLIHRSIVVARHVCVGASRDNAFKSSAISAV